MLDRVCPSCEGRGKVIYNGDTEPTICPRCKGTKVIQDHPVLREDEND